MSDTQVITNEVRFSYAYVFKPRADEGEEPKYSIMLLIPKKDREGVARIRKAIKACILANKEKLKVKDVDNLPATLNYPLRDGDAERDGEEYEGMFFMNANSKRRPGVVGKNPKQIIDDPEEFYAGSYGRASVNFFAYDFKGKKGVGCQINNLQKLREGDRLDGGKSAFEDFDDGFAGDDDNYDDYKPSKSNKKKSTDDDWL